MKKILLIISMLMICFTNVALAEDNTGVVDSGGVDYNKTGTSVSYNGSDVGVLTKQANGYYAHIIEKFTFTDKRTNAKKTPYITHSFDSLDEFFERDLNDYNKTNDELYKLGSISDANRQYYDVDVVVTIKLNVALKSGAAKYGVQTSGTNSYVFTKENVKYEMGKSFWKAILNTSKRNEIISKLQAGSRRLANGTAAGEIQIKDRHNVSHTTVSYGKVIYVDITSEKKLKTVKYGWNLDDPSDYTALSNIDRTGYSFRTPANNRSYNLLQIYAEDISGNKKSKTIKLLHEDGVDPNSNSDSNGKIKISIRDYTKVEEVEPGTRYYVDVTSVRPLKSLKYRWNYSRTNKVAYSTVSVSGKTKHSYKIYVPNTNFRNNDIYILAEDKDGLTEANSYIFANPKYTEDSGSANIKITSPQHGKFIDKNQSISAKITSNYTIKELKYSKNGSSYKKSNQKDYKNLKFKTLNPVYSNSIGTYSTIKLKATATNGSSKTVTFKYYVTPADGDTDDDADITITSPQHETVITENSSIYAEVTSNLSIKSLYYSKNGSSYRKSNQSPSKTLKFKTEDAIYDHSDTQKYSKIKLKAIASDGTVEEETFIFYVNKDTDEAIDGKIVITSPQENTTIEKESKVDVHINTSPKITEVKYKWNSGSYKASGQISNHSYDGDFTFTSPDNDNSTNKLYIKAENAEGVTGTRSFIYRYSDSDTSLSASPGSKSRRIDIEPEEDIRLRASDDDGIDWIEYYWEDDDDDKLGQDKEYDDDFRIEAPRDEGRYSLYMRAKDDDGNVSDWVEYEYDIDREYVEDTDLEITLENEKRESRFPIDTRIDYVIKIKNDDNTTAKDVEVEFEFPDGFRVRDDDNGDVDDNVITWKISSLSKNRTKTYNVTLEADDNDLINTIVGLKAKALQNDDTQDEATLLNFIYKTGQQGDHLAYIRGYKEEDRSGNEIRVFKPNNNITRAEYATMLVRLFDIDGYYSSEVNQFTDVARQNWAYKYIMPATSQGLFEGYRDGSFRPNSKVTKAQFVTVLLRQLNKEYNIGFYEYEASNSNKLEEQYKVLEAITGYDEGFSMSSFRPNDYIDREEAVIILNRVTFRGPMDVNYNYFEDKNTNDIIEASIPHEYTRKSNGSETFDGVIDSEMY